jgi:pre-mRNA-splicing factor 38A
MANRTVKDARNVHGTNPQYLVEKIIRSRVYDSKFWKEQCFALTAELLVDKAMELRFIGGVFGGNIKPTPFICLILKMLQIQPEKDIVVEFIKNEEFKYVRALGAYYLRLTGSSLDCYKYLEPLYNDNRKLRKQNRDGQFVILHIDEFIDELLREERVLDVILPRIQKRAVLEENNDLDPKTSALDDLDLDEEIASDEEMIESMKKEAKRREQPKVDRSRDDDRETRRHEKRKYDDMREEPRDRERNYEKERDRRDYAKERERQVRERDRDRSGRHEHQKRRPDDGRDGQMDRDRDRHRDRKYSDREHKDRRRY